MNSLFALWRGGRPAKNYVGLNIHVVWWVVVVHYLIAKAKILT